MKNVGYECTIARLAAQLLYVKNADATPEKLPPAFRYYV
jgi:hypothetical protein